MTLATVTRLARWAAWLLLAALAVVTLGPIGLRPISQAPVGVEHMLAFAALGIAFALAYPRHLILVLALVIGAAVLLEFGQAIDPGRHGRVADAVQKLIGGGMGVAIGAFVIFWLRPDR